MSTSRTVDDRRFYRDADRAMLGGVCAGIAGYLGFNLFATRFIAVIALFMTGPIFIIAYIAAALLIPSASGREYPYEVDPRAEARRESRRERRHKRRAERLRRKTERYDSYRESVAAAPEVSARAAVIREKCAELDARLQMLERHVTSRKFQIDQELSRL